jgi:hypothetical protein
MNLEKLLAENMRRFGTKNLNEAQKRHIKQLILEQINTYEAPDPRTGTYPQRNVPSAEWQIDGFTAPEINNMSENGSKLFKDAYRTYMDLSNGMIGKTLIVFKNATSIDNCVWDPKNVYLRIPIQSSWVPGPKAKDVTATGLQGQANSIKIWSTTQATRNYEIATKTAVMKSEGQTEIEFQPAHISLMVNRGGGQFGDSIYDPLGGMVRVGFGEYQINSKYQVYQSGKLIGICPINFDTDSRFTPEGWGTVLVSGGYPEANSKLWGSMG